MINRLRDRLLGSDLSLVVESREDELRCFTGRGVADIYNLYVNERELLSGARLADKVVGVGAAALMVASGVAELYAGVISRRATELFRSYGVDFEFGSEVPYIVNRTGDGWCPLESRCRDVEALDDILQQVHSFVAEMRLKELNECK